VLYEILSTLVPMLVPVMPHMAEDIWLNLPQHQQMKINGQSLVSITLLPWPEVKPEYVNPELETEFNKILELRECVLDLLEEARKNNHIGSALEAQVLIQALNPQSHDILIKYDPEFLATLFIVSKVAVVTPFSEEKTIPPAWSVHANWSTTSITSEFEAEGTKATGNKCVRCWRYDPAVGQFADHPQLCRRCHEAVRAYQPA
jgi:isoleucyl-tRNA synthetase